MTNILVFLSSLLQRIFESGSLTMGAIGFDGAWESSCGMCRIRVTCWIILETTQMPTTAT